MDTKRQRWIRRDKFPDRERKTRRDGDRLPETARDEDRGTEIGRGTDSQRERQRLRLSEKDVRGQKDKDT